MVLFAGLFTAVFFVSGLIASLFSRLITAGKNKILLRFLFIHVFSESSTWPFLRFASTDRCFRSLACFRIDCCLVLTIDYCWQKSSCAFTLFMRSAENST
ncbi:unnamed protein product [Pylaiella littoralis]